MGGAGGAKRKKKEGGNTGWKIWPTSHHFFFWKRCGGFPWCDVFVGLEHYSRSWLDGRGREGKKGGEKGGGKGSGKGREKSGGEKKRRDERREEIGCVGGWVEQKRWGRKSGISFFRAKTNPSLLVRRMVRSNQTYRKTYRPHVVSVGFLGRTPRQKSAGV